MPRYETSLPHAVRDIENVWITLSDGCRLAARIWLPDEGAGGARSRDPRVHPLS